jgi:hypothetical protein
MNHRPTFMVALFALVALLSACSGSSGVHFIPEGASYTPGDLGVVRDTADAGTLADAATAEAPSLRQEYLASLRRRDADASALADALTTQFPPDHAGVPFYVERGSFDSTPAWIVVEAWGSEGGRLENRRVWVFSLDSLTLLAAQ